MSSVVEAARPLLDSTRQGANRAGRALKRFVRSNPVLAVGLSLGMGVVVGWLVKRR
jgi:ElaB/YqjD/DUF883 family membrane-anchored ribosome-binding protein